MEELRDTMHLIEDNQLVLVVGKVLFRVGKSGEVSDGFNRCL